MAQLFVFIRGSKAFFYTGAAEAIRRLLRAPCVSYIMWSEKRIKRTISESGAAYGRA
jgi:hypothetical protein